MKQTEALPAGPEWLDKDIREFNGSPFKRIGSDWFLITAADIKNDRGNWNTMTGAWGGLGVIWNKDVAFLFIRPSRHTFGFSNDTKVFTLSFFDERCRSALNICGEKSGRDCDKAKDAGLTPVYFGDGPDGLSGPLSGAVSFKEASDIIICKKIYAQDIDPKLFLDASIEKNYNGKDYHRMLIGEIIGYKTRA